MANEAFPQSPEVVWWSGDRAICLRSVKVKRQGSDYIRMYLVLTEQTIWRYGIDERNLDYELAVDGVYVQEYPLAHFYECTSNPENPMIIMTCNFDGTSSFGNDFINLKNELASKNDLISTLRGENKTLRDELKVAVERVRALRSKSV